MSAHYEPEGQAPPKSGLLLLQALIWVLFCIFALRFWYLQIYRGEEFETKARDNQLRQEAMFAPRGLVRDRIGKLVAVNEPAYALGLVREDCKDISTTLDKVTEWTGVDREALREKFHKYKRLVKPFEPMILVPELPFEQVAVIEANALFWPGLEIVVRPKRYYKQRDLLAHVLGYVADANEVELSKDSGLALGDNVGKGGLELVLESRLRGAKGLRQVEVDATGRRLKQKILREPLAGEHINLAIDLGLQTHAARQLEGQAGAIVVMEPTTGKVLAFVSQPSYDANMFVTGLSQKQWSKLRDDPMHPLQNRVIQSMFPPGSIYKLVVGGALLEDGFSPKETVYCGGQIKLGRRVFRCWKKHGHGRVDYQKAQVNSCDVYFYAAGDRLGVEKMSTFAKDCGFGQKTNISLPHEKTGLVPTPEWKRKRFGEPWVGGDNLNMAIGQGFNLVTPIQVARFISALINGGTLYRPLLLADAEPEVQGQLPMSELNRTMIVDAMVETVQSGTARRLKRKGVRMGGKTGTAQVVRLKLKEGDERRKTEEMDYRERDHAWLASFGEKDGKSYVAICMVEHGGHGGSAAGPVLKSIYDYLFSEKMQ
ncbi:penicillin-binding protein 2 [Desulfovibrio ferrophilus]|uniref:Penicillin-binding protein 2 n=1 Tax=Desulfovibrio ferrophilus TaxID=241368 RepID=A0A2Z6B2L4_9BACT|nr:penicillin-binding protein 2 [Desulfovibrio ferrophilus]BBD09666.1 penicillin-binding protein 2 [Desulfovibrio ferrophilus]